MLVLLPWREQKNSLRFKALKHVIWVSLRESDVWGIFNWEREKRNYILHMNNTPLCLTKIVKSQRHRFGYCCSDMSLPISIFLNCLYQYLYDLKWSCNFTSTKSKLVRSIQQRRVARFVCFLKEGTVLLESGNVSYEGHLLIWQPTMQCWHLKQSVRFEINQQRQICSSQ